MLQKRDILVICSTVERCAGNMKTIVHLILVCYKILDVLFLSDRIVRLYAFFYMLIFPELIK